MSDLLCRWLNQELRLSKVVEPQTFAKDFSTGYLIGEVLHKYQLQNDFSMFTKKDTSISKVNNFTRLEPSFHLLGIAFDINTAHELMQEKHGVATRLLYHLYTALEKKKRAEITGTMMKIMQPAAIANQQKREHDSYSDRLHQMVKRDAELKLQKIAQHYEERSQQMNNRSAKGHPIQHKIPLKVHAGRKKNIEKLRVSHQTKTGIMAFNQAAIVQVPKPPPYTKQLNLKMRRRQLQQRHREQQAKTVEREIAQFETNRQKMATSGVFSITSRRFEVDGSGSQFTLQSSNKYMQEIRLRLEESAQAREQREKRRDRFLVEQLKAHEAQEEARRDEQLVKRLTRQTQQEKRLASQLLQMRMQKEVIRKNRLFREQQYEQRRERDLEEALEREAALVQQGKLDRTKEIQKELEFFNKIAAERSRRKYEKHFQCCMEIVEQILDLATKMGEYRVITANQIPEKMIKEWKELLLNGLPIYEPNKGMQPAYEIYTPRDPIERKRLELLNNQNYDEYADMVGDWAWPDDGRGSPPPNNNILGHAIQRLKNIVYPPLLETNSPSFPLYTIKACVLGNLCSGKTTCLSQIAAEHDIVLLSPDALVEAALNAHIKGEQLSPLAVLGAAAQKELKKGQGIPDEMIVDIVVEAVRRVPAHSGWILDGFPMDATQACLLEKALGGSVEGGEGLERKRTDLALDPDPQTSSCSADAVLNMCLLLKVCDDTVIRRAFSHTDKADATKDKNLYLAQIPQRISAFRDTWPKLELFYGVKQNILAHVDANVDDEKQLYERVHAVLQTVMIQKPEVFPQYEDVACPVDSPQQALKKKKLPKKSCPKVMSVVTENDRGAEPPASNKNFIDEPLPPEIPENLYGHWEIVCEAYVNGVRRALQILRSQSIVIHHHLYNISEDFKHFLHRPDTKHEFVSQWQKDFNSISGDMREDEETKAELHLRLDELHERLGDISNKRKEQNEEKRSAIMRDGWLEDHSSVILNHHSGLIQVEVNRFQETLCVLRVYYSSMCGEVMFEPHSHFVTVPLLGSPEMKDRSESTIEPASSDLSGELGEAEPGTKQPRKIEFTLQLIGDSSKLHGHDHADSSKPSHHKLTFDHDEALKAINRLVLAELHQGELKEPEKPPEPEIEKPPPPPTKGKKGKEKAKDPKPSSEPLEPPPVVAPVVYEVKKKPYTCDPDLRKRIHKEYVAALEHEEKAAKVRIALVKAHGLAMLQKLQSGAEKVFTAMRKSLEANYQEEIKSIDQLIEVVRHHIETHTKLQNELILECTDFYLNGDCLMVPAPTPPPPLPPLEKPTPLIPTIIQLEILYHQLCSIAPSGLMSSSEFFNLLQEITSVNIGRTKLPEGWINMSEKQLLEIVSVLMDQYELVDWRQFLLSAALPWPLPSLSELLDVLQRFKAVDVDNTGYINCEQYLQAGLWFSSETVQDVPENPNEPPKYDRVFNLLKFFFQLFADHSLSPPRLDYVSMLQYFAADPNPRQCFIRALSLVLGQALQLPSEEQLVKSMPSIQEEDAARSPVKDGDESKEASSELTSLFLEHEVSISALLAVICHKVTQLKDDSMLPPGCLSQEEHIQHLNQIFRELGYEPEESVPFFILTQHLFIQDLMENSTHYKLVNLHGVIQKREVPEEEPALPKVIAHGVPLQQ